METYTIDWEEYALCYDQLLVLNPYTQMLESVTSYVEKLSPRRILDASCGTGNFEMFLNPKQKVEVFGIDSSKEMLSRAKRKSRYFDKNITSNFSLTDLDQVLPFENNFFDVVVSINTIYATKSPTHSLRELNRVLAPGGVLFLVTPIQGYENGLILKSHCADNGKDEPWLNGHESEEKEEMLLRKTFDDEKVIQDMLLIARHNRYIANQKSFYFPNEKEIKQLLKDTSFKISEISFTYANQDFFIIATKGD